VREFDYARPADVREAVSRVSADPASAYLAGGTTQVDLMLKDGILDVERLVDITRLPLHGIRREGDALWVGALTTMEELAADPAVIERLPFVVVVGEPDPDNPIGVKGIGEVGLVGIAAAIANAVYHATGKRIRSLPITIDQLL
jgi:hypothetical protein